MVGVETADLLVARGCAVTIVEMQATLAPAMARNNRFEILSRLERAGVSILTDARLARVEDKQLIVVRSGKEVRIDPGELVILALGAVANRDVVPSVEEAGVPYVLVGDCLQPGDFLTAIRDASMAALAVNHLPEPGGAW